MNGQQVHGKMLDLPNRQTSANQTRNETPPHTSEDGSYEKNKKNKKKAVSVGKDVESWARVHCWRE